MSTANIENCNLNSVPTKCCWEHDEHDDTWLTSCRQVWHFIEGGPKENGVKFCHHCGKHVAIETPDD